MIHHHIHKKIKQVRAKPQRVRENILLVSMAILTPIVLTIWFANFTFSSHEEEINTIKTVKSNITATYKDTLSIDDIKKPNQ